MKSSPILLVALTAGALIAGTACEEDITEDGSSSGEAPCSTCKEVTDGDAVSNTICAGPPEDALAELNTCVCGIGLVTSGSGGGSGGGGGAGGSNDPLADTCRDVCLDSACQNTQASDACFDCVTSKCSTEFDACQAL